MEKKILKIETPVIDSHCHLDAMKQNIDDVIENAKNHGVSTILTICTELADIEKIKPILKKHKNVFTSFGIHPEFAETDVLSADDIISYAKSTNAIGIGEVGLEYFNADSSKKSQKENFKNHIIAASKLNLPLIIHSRQAEDDTIAILEEMKAKYRFKAILHCYSSDKKLADYAIKNDIYISASGIITFNKSEELREVFKTVPKNLLLVETDAPFLAPVPFRGKECEPAMVNHTLQTLAELQGISAEKMAKITTDNFNRLFKINKRT